MSIYESESGCKFGEKCSFAHRQVEGQPTNKPKKDSEKNAVAILKDARRLDLRISGHRAARIFTDFYGRAQKSWDQFDECDSQKLRSVMQTSEKTRVHRSEQFKSKFFVSAVRTL